MRIVLCPDSFKGSFSASEFCKIASTCWQNDELIQMPMADGGEGSLQALQPLLKEAKKVIISASDPLGRTIKATYLTAASIAYIELAQASGFELIKQDERDIMKSNTYGTGQIIAHAFANGFYEVVLFAGGSATNDGGMGIASALGIEFYNDKGAKLAPIAENLVNVAHILKREDVYPQITVATDVVNPLCGENGAAYSFARQKGANEEQIVKLDEGLQNLALIIKKDSGIDISYAPRMGAAGGIGACLAGLLNATMVSATSLLIEKAGLDQVIKNADLVVTGEGCFDNQSLNGKLVGNILSLCDVSETPCLVVTGTKAAEYNRLYCTFYELKHATFSQQYAIEHGAEMLKDFFCTHPPTLFVT